ncbi:hypothetical protein GCM10028818_50700 [Spirosoma horti]
MLLSPLCRVHGNMFDKEHLRPVPVNHKPNKMVRFDQSAQVHIRAGEELAKGLELAPFIHRE